MEQKYSALLQLRYVKIYKQLSQQATFCGKIHERVCFIAMGVS